MLENWYLALRSENGVCIRTDDFEATRQKLYAARREVLDSDLDGLSICQSPTDPNELWIVKKGSPSDPPSE